VKENIVSRPAGVAVSAPVSDVPGGRMGGSLPAELLTSDRHFERVAGLACTIC
jgi:hypothetical protein